MSAIERPPRDASADERACAGLVHRYAALADADDAEAFVALFEVDALWGRPDGQQIRGHAGIRAAYASRVRGRFSRHLVTGVAVDLLAPDRATVNSTALVLKPRGDAAELVGFLVSNIDEMSCQDNGAWRIRSRRSQLLAKDIPFGVIA